MEPSNETPAPVPRSARAEKHRVYMKTYNRKYVRKTEQKRSLEGQAYDSIYKLAKATADRKAANGGFLKRENGVITSPDTLRFKKYLQEHNRKAFIAYLDADLRDSFMKHCKANGLSSARVLEQIIGDYLSYGNAS